MEHPIVKTSAAALAAVENGHLGVWLGLSAVVLGGLIAAVIVYFKSKKDDR